MLKNIYLKSDVLGSNPSSVTSHLISLGSQIFPASVLHLLLHNKLPHTSWLKTTPIDWLTVLSVKCPDTVWPLCSGSKSRGQHCNLIRSSGSTFQLIHVVLANSFPATLRLRSPSFPPAPKQGSLSTSRVGTQILAVCPFGPQSQQGSFLILAPSHTRISELQTQIYFYFFFIVQ